MGCVSSTKSKNDAKTQDREDNRKRLSVIWEELGSAEVLNLAKTDPEVFQICLKENIIRQHSLRRCQRKMFGNATLQACSKM